MTPQEINEQIIDRCKNNLGVFLNNLKTFDPRTNEKDLPFELYDYELEYAYDLARAIAKKEDLFIEKSRDMGVSWVTCGVLLWFWLFYPGFQALIGSRKEDYVDNGQVDSLFGKLDYFLRHLPFKPGFNWNDGRTFSKLINPTNKAAILGESANANFSRSGRYNIVFFDELAFWLFQQASWEAAGESTPCRLAVTTPSPTPSYAKNLRNSGLIKVKTILWSSHPNKTRQWYEEQRKRKTADEVAREIDINWEGSASGIVYPEIMNATVGDYPYIPDLAVYLAWDFGLDGMAIQLWQRNHKENKYRLIDSIFNQNKVIDYYKPLFGGEVDSRLGYSEDDLEFMRRNSQYAIEAIHYGDPDVYKRNLQTGDTNQSAIVKSLGIYIQTNTTANNEIDRKTELKRILQQGIEVNDTIGNMFWLESMRNYRYPERQENSQAVTAVIKPIHNIYSHHPTASEYFSVNQPLSLVIPENKPLTQPEYENKVLWDAIKRPVDGFGNNVNTRDYDNFTNWYNS